jgi:AmpD protein
MSIDPGERLRNARAREERPARIIARPLDHPRRAAIRPGVCTAVADYPVRARPHRSLAVASRTRRSSRPTQQRLAIDGDGNVNVARQVRSPNRDARPPDIPISLIVLHGISLPPGCFDGDGIERLFTNRLDPQAHPYFATIAAMRVSAHFLVRRDGALLQFVPCAERAWHAGESAWRGRARCNDFSIGIELEGTDAAPYAAAQYATLARLVRALRRRYPIEAVVGHSDVAPGRKTDPGPAFDWPRLTRLLAPRLRSRYT